ncbi:unnamed protein product [Pylaiella littoralis]
MNFVPGRKPSWHSKQLFGDQGESWEEKEEEEKEEERSGAFSSLTDTTSKNQGSPESILSISTMSPDPVQNPPEAITAASGRSPKEYGRSPPPCEKSNRKDWSETVARSAAAAGSTSTADADGQPAPASTVWSTTASEAAPVASTSSSKVEGNRANFAPSSGKLQLAAPPTDPAAADAAASPSSSQASPPISRSLSLQSPADIPSPLPYPPDYPGVRSASLKAVAILGVSAPELYGKLWGDDRPAAELEGGGGGGSTYSRKKAFLTRTVSSEIMGRLRSTKKAKGTVTVDAATAAATAGPTAATKRTAFRRRSSPPGAATPRQPLRSPATATTASAATATATSSFLARQGNLRQQQQQQQHQEQHQEHQHQTEQNTGGGGAVVLPSAVDAVGGDHAAGFDPPSGTSSTADDVQVQKAAPQTRSPAESGKAPQRGADIEGEDDTMVVLAATLSLKGVLECGRAITIKGSFEGELRSTGDITVAPGGSIKGDLKGLKFLLVQGQVVGNVICDTVEVLEDGQLIGDITAKSITISPQAKIRGRLNVVKDKGELGEASANTGAAAIADASIAEKGVVFVDQAEEDGTSARISLDDVVGVKSTAAKEEVEEATKAFAAMSTEEEDFEDDYGDDDSGEVIGTAFVGEDMDGIDMDMDVNMNMDMDI